MDALWLFLSLAIPVLVLSIVLALGYMPSRHTSLAVKLDVGLAWSAAISTLVLVPADVATTFKVAYWYGFATQFTVLPFHQEFADSGHFFVRDRIIESLRNNAIYYLILPGLTAVSVLLLLLLSGELDAADVTGFSVAVSNAFGLIAGLMLLGFGLVSIPRYLWRAADAGRSRRQLFHRAGVQAEQAMAAHKEMSKQVTIARHVARQFRRSDPLIVYIDRITAMAEACARDCSAHAVELDDDAEVDYFDRLDLGGLRKRLRQGREHWEREAALFKELIREYLNLEDVIKNKQRPGEPFASSTHGPLPRWAARGEWWWRCWLKGPMLRVAAVLLGAYSLAVVVAEATIAPQLPNLSVFGHTLSRVSGNTVATELLCFLYLIYPCACAYWGMYKLGRFNFYRLVPGHTAPYSLLANALIMCRFAAPLAFNFVAALAMPPSPGHHTKDTTDTVFYARFGNIMMSLPVLGLQYQRWLPIAIVPYILLLMSGFFDKVVQLITRSRAPEFEDDHLAAITTPQAAQGTRLMRQELDNHSKGLQLGLSILPASGAPDGRASPVDDELLPPAPSTSSSGWWQRVRGRPAPPDIEQPPGAGLRTGEASAAGAARDRLARAAGRAPVRQASNMRQLLSPRSDGLSQDDEVTRLLPGAGPQGLDSVFASFEDQQQRQRESNRGHAHTLRVESESEDGTAAPVTKGWNWFRRM